MRNSSGRFIEFYVFSFFAVVHKMALVNLPPLTLAITTNEQQKLFAGDNLFSLFNKCLLFLFIVVGSLDKLWLKAINCKIPVINKEL